MKNLFYDLPKELQIAIYEYEPKCKKMNMLELLFYKLLMTRKATICRLVHKYIGLIE